jgi:sugar phosphate isomerase/epimerase
MLRDIIKPQGVPGEFEVTMIVPCIFSDEVSKDFAEAVPLSVAAGARALEIRGGLWEKNVTTVTDEGVKRMQDVLAQHGARVAVIGSPVGKCHHDRREEVEQHTRHFERMIQLARAFGTDIIRGFAFWDKAYRETRKHTPLERNLDMILPLLRPIVQRAEQANVVLAIEPEADTMVGTCREARLLIDALGSPNVAFCWDVNNACGCGESPMPDGYEHIKGFVRHVHVKPNRNKSLATVADSKATYEQVLRALKADGYRGAASIEHWGSREDMLEGVRQLVEVLEKINS